jgi:hypothetical protein
MTLPINDRNSVTGHVRGLHTRTLHEFSDKLKPALDVGRPVPLGIVRTTFDPTSPDFGAIWENHQELAIGYFQNGSEWVLEAYDPNAPNTIVYLWLDRRVETIDRQGQHVVDHFRGVFANADNYASHDPFWLS